MENIFELKTINELNELSFYISDRSDLQSGQY